MVTVRIILTGDLPQLLRKKYKKKHAPSHGLSVTFSGKRTVMDLVQSLGVPHTEIASISVNGAVVDWSHTPGPGDAIEVRPFATGVPPVVMDPPRFLCDVHLWKLARRLRFLGFETHFDPRWDDPELADISQRQRLILLSRDRGLLMRNNVEWGLLIRCRDPEQQVTEVLDRLGIREKMVPFSRCLLCGHRLRDLDTASGEFQRTLKPDIPASVLRRCREFRYCDTCRKIFWRGSHYKKLDRLLTGYLAAP